MALGPLAAAFVVIPYGQASIAWFGIAAGLATVVMLRVGHWPPLGKGGNPANPFARRRKGRSVGLLPSSSWFSFC